MQRQNSEDRQRAPVYWIVFPAALSTMIPGSTMLLSSSYANHTSVEGRPVSRIGDQFPNRDEATKKTGCWMPSWKSSTSKAPEALPPKPPASREGGGGHYSLLASSSIAWAANPNVSGAMSSLLSLMIMMMMMTMTLVIYTSDLPP